MNLLETLRILRHAGFFKDFGGQSDEEILEVIQKNRSESYSKDFGYNYKPEKISGEHVLATQDSKKMLWFDMEADVCQENKVYVWLIQALADASDGHLQIENIEEDWLSEEGPIKVSFLLNGQKIELEPKYVDDWIDENVIEVIIGELSKISEQKFEICVGPGDTWLGQDVNYIRLTHDERKILEEKLNWKFFDTFLKEQN